MDRFHKTRICETRALLVWFFSFFFLFLSFVSVTYHICVVCLVCVRVCVCWCVCVCVDCMGAWEWAWVRGRVHGAWSIFEGACVRVNVPCSHVLCFLFFFFFSFVSVMYQRCVVNVPTRPLMHKHTNAFPLSLKYTRKEEKRKHTHQHILSFTHTTYIQHTHTHTHTIGGACQGAGRLSPQNAGI